MDYLLFFAFGLAAFIYSSVGHAGASAYIAIMSIASFAPLTMRPIALILNVIVAFMGSIRYFKAGLTDNKLFIPLIIGSVPFAFFGGMIKINDTYFKISVGIILILTGVRLLFPKGIPVPSEEKPPHFLISFVLGAGIGFISGITGTGGGIFLSPILLFLGWASLHSISGTAIIFILFTSLAGLMGIFTTVNTIPLHSLLYAIPVMIGAFLGQSYGIKADRKILVRILALVLMVAGAKLVLTS